MRRGELTPSAHRDSFTRDNLPPPEQWPDLLLEHPEFRYPARLNCATELLDRNIARGRGNQPAIVSPTETLTYSQLADRVDRIAQVLVTRFDLLPGNRVLLRSANNAWMVAAYFAVLKAGGVVVASMPLLRAKELGQMLRKGRISHALCDGRLAEELWKAEAPDLRHLVTWGDGQLEGLCEAAAPGFAACDTAAEDVCLIGFTSGSTGEPKGTLHFHRDMLAICDSYGMQVLRPEPADVFIGSPPLAFTFGLGGLVLFPFRVGATAILLEKASPEDLAPAIARHRATICFTAPTAYRVMAGLAAQHDLSSLRKCVSAGEALPKAVFEAWQAATGLKLMDGIGATELLHIFIAATEERIRPGATGLPVPGYEAKVVDKAGGEVPRGTPGRLAVRGPTGCRYLADPRQAQYVQQGWNITGDTYVQDQDGYFWYQARNDDMIVSAGYNIAGPEVEAALLTHPAVKECGVIGAPDPERGMVVRAYVVLARGHAPDEAMAKALQDHVKREIAPYKYPRSVVFVPALPRTGTGKLQRFALRQQAAEEAGSSPMTSPLTTLQPEGWPPPRGYSNGMMGRGQVVLVGGQVGWDRDGRFPTGLVAQTRQALLNILAVLRAAGGGPEHIGRLTWYVVDMAEYRACLKDLGPAYREVMGRHFPAMALVQVVALVEAEARVEIEATAIIPD